MRRFFICVAAVAICVTGVAKEAWGKEVQVQTDPAIQESLSEIVDALDASSLAPKASIEALQEIEELKVSVGEGGDIIEQLAVYAAAPGEQQPLMALAILQLLDFPPRIVIPSLVPYLDDENVKVRSFARDWFQGHDNGGANETKLKPVNFEDYADYVRTVRKAENVPAAFVQYLYDRSPNRAFLIFARAERQSEAVKGLEAIRKKMEQQRGVNVLAELPQPRAGIEKNELLLAEHMISHAIWLKKYYFHERFPQASKRAKDHLSSLAQHDKWWARLYVAEIMRRHRELRQADVLEKLSKDTNALVRKSAKIAAD